QFPDRLVGVAQHAWPAELADAVDHLGRPGAVQGQVAAVDDQVWALALEVRDDVVECVQVALHVGDDGDLHALRLALDRARKRGGLASRTRPRRGERAELLVAGPAVARLGRRLAARVVTRVAGVGRLARLVRLAGLIGFARLVRLPALVGLVALSRIVRAGVAAVVAGAAGHASADAVLAVGRRLALA